MYANTPLGNDGAASTMGSRKDVPMETVDYYRKYAAEILELAERADCEDEKARLATIAREWLQLAATLSAILDGEFPPGPGKVVRVSS